MPAVVVNTIGVGGNYSTIQTWEDACPANLVTADQIWRGECLNQEFVTPNTVLTVGGITTDATRYIELTAVAGASFADHANARTNALRYDATKGAALRTSGYGASGVIASNVHFRISRLQIKATGDYSVAFYANGCGLLLDQMILVGGWGSGFSIINGAPAGSSVTVRNTLSITRWAGSGFACDSAGIVFFENCTAIRPTDSYGGHGFSFSYTGTNMRNCAAFGFESFAVVWSVGTCSNNASDKPISFGSNNLQNLTYASQFEAIASESTFDARLKTASSLINAGIDLSANGLTKDIVGFTRSGSYDIGVWESSSAPHTLNALGITTGGPTVSNPTLGILFNLLAVGINTNSPIVNTPILSQAHVFTANPIATNAPSLNSPVLGHIYVFTANPISTGGPSVSSALLTQIHSLIANSILAGSPIINNPSLNLPAVIINSRRLFTLPERIRSIVVVDRGRSIVLDSRNRAVSLIGD